MAHEAEFEEELDLTPLIDVAFLLQIFFMLTSTATVALSGGLRTGGGEGLAGELTSFDFLKPRKARNYTKKQVREYSTHSPHS